MDPCPYLVQYSLDIFKKKTYRQKMFNKTNIELSPKEIWLRIRFLEINGSLSLIIISVCENSICFTFFYVRLFRWKLLEKLFQSVQPSLKYWTAPGIIISSMQWIYYNAKRCKKRTVIYRKELKDNLTIIFSYLCPYNVVTNNCEHIASWARNCWAHSRQVADIYNKVLTVSNLWLYMDKFVLKSFVGERKTSSSYCSFLGEGNDKKFAPIVAYLHGITHRVKMESQRGI